MRLRVTVLTAFLVMCAAVPAQATFPGRNGKIAFESAATLYTVNLDGSALTNLGPGREPAWSPDGTRIAFRNETSGPSDPNRIYVMDSDGSDLQLIAERPDQRQSLFRPAWSPNATRLAYTETEPDSEGPFNRIRIHSLDGSPATPFNTTTCQGVAGSPDWSPSGQRIAFTDDSFAAVCLSPGSVYTANTDGTGLLRLAAGLLPSWSPDGQRILFRDRDAGLSTVNANGTGLTALAGDEGVVTGFGGRARWSPDGSKIVFPRSVGGVNQLWVMDPDGSNGHAIFETTSTVWHPDWQPIPVNSYPRPKGATPLQVYLVPAYAPCSASNRTHGPPLAFPSCSPPAQQSTALTVGTPDANAKPPKSVSSVRFDTVAGNPATAADEADVQVAAGITDVYESGTLADYAGDVRGTVGLRITDKLNTPHPGGPGAGTVSNMSLEFTVPCSPTADTTVGSTCALTTTVDALTPGAVTEGRRAIWELGQVEVEDAGGAPFLRQGIFIP